MSETEDTQRHRRMIEAVLFASSEPLSEKALAARLPDGVALAPLLEDLRADYAERGVNLIKAGGAWAFRTAPDMAALLSKEIEVSRKLSRAAIETLAIIAYHQPITRAEIEEVRGVSLSKGTLDVLFEEGWIRPKGKRRTPGRPTTWGTTDGFLDHFGLESLKDLPGMDELKAAGLLDARPAIEAYSVHGALGGDEDVDEKETAEAAADSILPAEDPLDVDEGADAPTPLDPDAED
jgi:segregation and condensation protein B